jgi:hydrogenase maturation protease
MSVARRAVLIGVGNSYRRDDGIGPALAAVIGELDLPGVSVVISDGEPSRLLDAWSEASLAVVVDATRCDGGVPGQIRCHDVTGDRVADGWTAGGSASTHGLGIGEAIHLAKIMDQMPERLVVFAVEAADIGYGEHMSQAVSASLPELTEVVLAELRSS